MALIDPNNTSAFNQGLMELGALICTPTSPKCLLCPVRDYCTAFHEGDPAALPVKSKKIKTKNIDYDVLVIRDPEGRYLMEKRAEQGLLANMWQFVMIERQADENSYSIVQEKYGIVLNEELAVPIIEFKHIFSHLKWLIDSYLVDALQVPASLPDNMVFLTKEQIEQLPMPVPMLKIWNKIK